MQLEEKVTSTKETLNLLFAAALNTFSSERDNSGILQSIPHYDHLF